MSRQEHPNILGTPTADDQEELQLWSYAQVILRRKWIILACVAVGVTLAGLRWPLTDEVLLATSSLGVSNVADGESITVTVEQGIVLVIVNDDAEG